MGRHGMLPTKSICGSEPAPNPIFVRMYNKLFEDIGSKMVPIGIQTLNTIFLLNKNLHNSYAVLKDNLPLSLMYINYISPCQRLQPLARLKV